MSILSSMKFRSNEEIMRDAIAWAFPLGSISELTRQINRDYQLSHDMFKDDPRFSERDVKALIGHVRRGLINKGFFDFSQQYSSRMISSEKMEGEEGDNNHVEVIVGNFLVTQHHHTVSESMPEKFINLSSSYNSANASVNEFIAPNWFDTPKNSSKTDLLNLLILHEKSRESLREVGRIEFVIPKGSQKFVTIGVSELAQKQSQLLDMDPEDLFDFKRRSADEMRKIIA